MKKFILFLGFLFFIAMNYFFFFSRELLYGSLALVICVVLIVGYAIMSTPESFSKEDDNN